jgi:photosystem II stability/assembly factor-like uncharacterized protein
MTKSSTLLRGVVSAGMLVLAAGCVSVSGTPWASSTPLGAGPVAGAVRHPGGPLPGLRYRYGGTATLTAAPPPASAALPGANDVVVAGRTPGQDARPGGAVLLAAANSGIWRSADSGATWQRVVSGIQAWSVSAMSGGGYAALGVVPGPNAPGLTMGVSQPELATSADGVSWQVTKVPEPSAQALFGYGYRFVLSGTGPASVGVAVPDLGAMMTGVTPGYRTADGGRHWTLLPLAVPGASGANGSDAAEGGIAMLPDGRTVFVTGEGQGAGCGGAVYESRDGGATWALLSGSCQRYPLQDVQFTSALDGFAAGGLTPKFGGGQVVEATTDGGLTWRVLYRTGSSATPPTTGFLRVDMTAGQGGSGQGWAVAGGCTGGQNGPCPGAVYVTTDGGTQWRVTGQLALSVAALGAGSAVAVDPLFTGITGNGGRTWTEQTRPETTQTLAFAGADGYQFWSTSLSTDTSADGGEQWAPLPALPAPLDAQASSLTWQAAPPSALFGYDEGSSQAWASADGAATWTASTVPGSAANPVLAVALGGGGAAYAVTGPGTDCLSPAELKKVQKLKPGWTPPSGASVLYASSDAGARWNAAGLVIPFGVQIGAAMAASSSQIAIIDACGRLELSKDAGQRWSAQSLGNAPICAVSMLGSQVWLYCQIVDQTVVTTWSLYSADRGATWLAYRLPAPADQALGIFLTGAGSAVMPIGGALWRTSDGGKSWTEEWIAPR